jgi:branched-chain amino acid transport system substrate-binding protein
MKRLVVLIAFALLAPNVATAQTAQPYEVYAITDLTGGASFVGKAVAQMLQVMERLVNRTGGIRGRPVHFVIEDSQSSPAIAVQLYTTILAKNVPIVIGPGFAATCEAVTPLAVNGPVTYCLSNAIHPPAGSYMFSSLASSGDLAVAAIRYYRSLGLKKIAWLNSTDATGSDGDIILRAALALPENRDVSLVAAEHFNPTDISVSAQLARIRASGAQAMIGWTTGSPFGTILRGMTDAGLDIPIVSHAGNVSTAEMEQFSAFLPRQLVLVGYRFLSTDRLPKALQDVRTVFNDSFREAGIKPDVISTIGWDGTLVAISALRKLGPDASAKQVRDYIGSLRDFPGINGYLDFTSGNQRGLTADAALIVRWDKDKQVWVPMSKPGGEPFK